jgi:hypothetical protein
LHSVDEENGHEYEADFEGIGHLSNKVRLKPVVVSTRNRKTQKTSLDDKVKESLAACDDGERLGVSSIEGYSPSSQRHWHQEKDKSDHLWAPWGSVIHATSYVEVTVPRLQAGRK